MKITFTLIGAYVATVDGKKIFLCAKHTKRILSIQAQSFTIVLLKRRTKRATHKIEIRHGVDIITEFKTGYVHKTLLGNYEVEIAIKYPYFYIA